jgi:hypothetical protein
MAKIQIAIFVDVEVSERDGHSWEALQEGFKTIEGSLKTNEKIGNVYYEGISNVYK